MPSTGPSGASPTGFPQSVIERVGFYVYVLRDSRNGEVFYVGKGKGNRVFAHAADALESQRSTDKLDRIRAIRDAGQEVDYEIVRHGLEENEAFEVESALIDWIGGDKLGNLVAGHNAQHRGRMTVPEIIAIYRAEPVTITEPSLLIIVNRLFKKNTDTDRLYEITRGDWVIGKRREKATLAIAVFKGLVRAVYRIESWEPVVSTGPDQKRRRRWRLSGVVADELQHLVGGDVTAYLGKSAQNPIRYVNC